MNSNKVTMILTFVVSTVIPFIQQIVDFISDLKGSSSFQTTAVSNDLREASDNFIQTVSAYVSEKHEHGSNRRFWR